MMKLLTSILLTITSLATVYAQISHLSFTVLNESTDKPIYEAYVNIYLDGDLLYTELTDLMGRVDFDHVSRGEVEIVVDKSGYDLHKSTATLSTAHKDILVKLTPSVDSSRDSYETSYISETKNKLPAPSLIEHNATMSIAAVSGAKSSYETSLPSSGQVTAGEWNDLHNWQDWLELLDIEEYQIMTSRWGISPTERYSVLVLNESDLPLQGISVHLLNNAGETIWSTKTDNVGKAELWSSVYEDENIGKIIVEYDQSQKEIANPTSIANGTNTVRLPIKCREDIKADIVFTVDATSSMSDEISYLKSELLDVIGRVRSEVGAIDLRTGAVFYRDLKDDYITRESPLTPKTKVTVDFIIEQYAAGGNDYPEAVDLALEKSVSLDWRADALKINFLILDAPPHEEEEPLSRVKAQVETAAKKGIRLIPVTASGINRETEFLMKFMSILTNGTYIFITDDSGIGLKHLDPVVNDYEVEKLNDLMVRVISNMVSSESCEAPSRETSAEIKVYPNPSVNYINIDTKEIPSKITITSNSGMVVLTSTPTSNSTRLELDELVSGVYTVSVYLRAGMESQQILIVR